MISIRVKILFTQTHTLLTYAWPLRRLKLDGCPVVLFLMYVCVVDAFYNEFNQLRLKWFAEFYGYGRIVFMYGN